MTPVTPRIAFAVAAALATAALPLTSGAAHAQTAPPASAPSTQTAPGKQVITSAEQLPRRTVKLDKLPSAYLSAPKPEILALAARLEASAKSDLEKFDIQDAATLRAYYGTLVSLAQYRGDWAALPPLIDKLRAGQDKPGPRATTGVMAGILADQAAGNRDAAWVQAEVTRRYGALPWQDVADVVRGFKGQMELMNPALVKGSFEQQLDVMARNMNMEVPEGLIGSIVGARLQEERILPIRGAIVAGLQAVIDRNAQTVAKPDIWTPRTFAIPASAKAREVNIAVWDSGVDMSLFKPAPGRGLAFDALWNPSPALLRPLGDAAPRWPQLQQLVKGSTDLSAAIDSEDARKLKQTVAGLSAAEAKSFQEDMALATLYIHGTHVAGIAVDGNPFARVFAASMHFSNKAEPIKPSEEISRRAAKHYGDIVAAFKANGVRVVNMSWRYPASAYEGALAWHNVGKSPEERKQMARALFAIERDALRTAIASAPDILFVAGSGNEDNSADFNEYIPGGFQLPNLITVGATANTGEETAFSTFGKTVVVHANGFEVESFLPGGARAKISGASMASPQVANLAGKLFALKPELTVAQVKDLILKGAKRNGRVNLINPRRSAELAGIKL